jgi:hypothetical protein
MGFAALNPSYGYGPGAPFHGGNFLGGIDGNHMSGWQSYVDER